jgi:hypothetical protein
VNAIIIIIIVKIKNYVLVRQALYVQLILNSKINLYIDEKSRANKSNFKIRKFRTSLKNNITTYNDLEGIYNKNFNIS